MFHMMILTYSGDLKCSNLMFLHFGFTAQCMNNVICQAQTYGPQMPSVISFTVTAKRVEAKGAAWRPLECSFQKYAPRSSFTSHWRQSPIKAESAQQQSSYFPPFYFEEITFCPKYLHCWFLAGVCEHACGFLYVCVWAVCSCVQWHHRGCRGKGSWKEKMFGLRRRQDRAISY